MTLENLPQTRPDNPSQPSELERLRIAYAERVAELDALNAQLTASAGDVAKLTRDLDLAHGALDQRSMRNAIVENELRVVTFDRDQTVAHLQTLRSEFARVNEALIAARDGKLVLELRERRLQLRAALKAQGGFCPADLDPSLDP